DDLAFGKQREIVETLSALGEPRARRLYLSTIDTAGWLAKAGDATRRDSLPQDLAQAEMLLHDIRRYAPDPTLVPFLEELSTRYDGALTDLVCAALGRIGAPRSVPFLIALLPEPMPGGRPGLPDKRAFSALQALRQISGENYDIKRAEWQSWWETHRAELETRTKPPEGPAAGTGQDAP
ncbi:MAG: hypothetical protein GX595_01525, partial [Lentisphaerae bacterium]|nr:hypothetical protein [Lentisphaerota bacterium]